MATGFSGIRIVLGSERPGRCRQHPLWVEGLDQRCLLDAGVGPIPLIYHPQVESADLPGGQIYHPQVGAAYIPGEKIYHPQVGAVNIPGEQIYHPQVATT